jgi:hypothetical protein
MLQVLVSRWKNIERGLERRFNSYTTPFMKSCSGASLGCLMAMLYSVIYVDVSKNILLINRWLDNEIMLPQSQKLSGRHLCFS